MQQQPDMMLGNGRGAQNVIGNRKYNVVRENKNTGADRTEANPTELNQNWGRNTNAFDIISQHEKEAIDERDEHKKGRPEKNSSKGRRIKIKLRDLPSTKDQQSGLIPKNGEGTQHVTSTENSNVVHENSNTASDHFEANPTELKWNSSTDLNSSSTSPTELKWNSSTDLNSSSTSPQLENEERDERELIKMTEKNIPCKRSSTMIEKERERLIDSVDNLHVENAVLKKQLLDLSDDYVKLKQENKAILEELIENFGQEKIVSLMIDEQLADLVESGNHN
ncbi:hypothetical protein Fmac_022363 [Flemingia macrophylla]|uniref:Uncharacterized protein n=1 Tax=Flemingia macrophylla TaxID=520843 RepID=A0ABD1LZP5_9FABA